jgi:hypothetical protein
MTNNEKIYSGLAKWLRKRKGDLTWGAFADKIGFRREHINAAGLKYSPKQTVNYVSDDTLEETVKQLRCTRTEIDELKDAVWADAQIWPLNTALNFIEDRYPEVKNMPTYKKKRTRTINKKSQIDNSDVGEGISLSEGEDEMEFRDSVLMFYKLLPTIFKMINDPDVGPEKAARQLVRMAHGDRGASIVAHLAFNTTGALSK